MNIQEQYFCCTNKNCSVQKINNGLSLYIYAHTHTHTLKIMKIGTKNEVEEQLFKCRKSTQVMLIKWN